MKHKIIILVLLAFSGCSGTPRPFVEGTTRITPPVKCLQDLTIEDGGTRYLKIADADGNIVNVYIDHRVGRTSEWGTVYLNAYPGESKSIKVINQVLFKELVVGKMTK